MKLTTGYQSKGSSIVALSNSSRGVTWHLPCESPSSRIAAWTISFLIIFKTAQKLHHVQEVDPKVEPLASQKY